MDAVEFFLILDFSFGLWTVSCKSRECAWCEQGIAPVSRRGDVFLIGDQIVT